jgi:hypothetical protein
VNMVVAATIGLLFRGLNTPADRNAAKQLSSLAQARSQLWPYLRQTALVANR